MALPPIRPSDSAAIVPQPGDPACTVLTNMVQGLTQWDQFVSWFINEDGSITQDAIDAIGAGGTNALAAPTGVSASEDRTADITITWNEVSDASYYVVYRGDVGDTSTMTVLSGNLTERSYVDSTVDPDVTYWYSVRAYSSSRVSALSTPDRGIMPTSLSATTRTLNFTYKETGVQDFTIPADPAFATMEILAWGSGGRGGRRVDTTGLPAQNPAPTYMAGGGGASGSFIHVTGIAITAGDVLSFQVGLLGVNDGYTYVWKGGAQSTEAVYAPPGGDGKEGNQYNPGGGGSPDVTYGDNTMGSGTIDLSGADSSTVGNAGVAGVGIVGGAGGAAVSVSGVAAGAGSFGNNVRTFITPSPGYIRIILRT